MLSPTSLQTNSKNTYQESVLSAERGSLFPTLPIYELSRIQEWTSLIISHSFMQKETNDGFSSNRMLHAKESEEIMSGYSFGTLIVTFIPFCFPKTIHKLLEVQKNLHSPLPKISPRCRAITSFRFPPNISWCIEIKEFKPLLHVETFSWNLCATALRTSFTKGCYTVKLSFLSSLRSLRPLQK